MSIHYGSTNIKDIYIGGTHITSAYIGSKLVWQEHGDGKCVTNTQINSFTITATGQSTYYNLTIPNIDYIYVGDPTCTDTKKRLNYLYGGKLRLYCYSYYDRRSGTSYTSGSSDIFDANGNFVAGINTGYETQMTYYYKSTFYTYSGTTIVHIVQQPHETITVTAGGTAYTSDFKIAAGTAYTVSVVADSGYTAGKLPVTSGIAVDDVTITAYGATHTIS